MEMTIRTNRAEVLSTGNVFVPYGEFVEFAVAGMTFRILFEQNSNDTASHVTYNVQQDNGKDIMAIHAYNFDNAILSTVNNILPLGRIEGRKLSLQMAVTTTNRREVEIDGVMQTQFNRLVYYTWYLERPQSNNT